MAVLVANGYEPFEDAEGAVRLRNCPFHALIERHRALTCSMNLALLDSLASELTDAGLAATAQTGNGSCCVAFVPAS